MKNLINKITNKQKIRAILKSKTALLMIMELVIMIGSWLIGFLQGVKTIFSTNVAPNQISNQIAQVNGIQFENTIILIIGFNAFFIITLIISKIINKIFNTKPFYNWIHIKMHNLI